VQRCTRCEPGPGVRAVRDQVPDGVGRSGVRPVVIPIPRTLGFLIVSVLPRAFGVLHPRGSASGPGSRSAHGDGPHAGRAQAAAPGRDGLGRPAAAGSSARR
jgi:hypothetical protein